MNALYRRGEKKDKSSRLGIVVPNSDGTLYLLETLPEIFLIDIAKNTMYSVYVRAVNPSDNVIRANFVTDTEIAVLESGQVFLINLDTGAKTALDCGSLDVRSVHKYKDKIYLTVIDGIYSFDQHSKTAQKLHSHVYNEPFYPYVGFTLSASILTSDKKSIILNSGRPRFYGLFNFESGQFQAFDVGVAATWHDGSPSQIGADEEAVLTRENRYKSSPEANEPLYFSADKIYSINHLEFNEKFIDFKIDVFDFSDIKNPVATYTYK